jgi:HEAT repeat protein
VPLVRKPGGHSPKAPPSAPAPDGSTILANLASASSEDRWSAARAAADVPGAVAPLAASIHKESDARVREAMFTSLARIATREAADHLISILRLDDANLRAGALDALRTFKTLGEFLPALLVDRDVDIRILSCELARELPGPEATAHLASLLGAEREVNVCAAAIDVLAEVGGPAALPVLADCAARLGHDPFLGFAIKTATERISAQQSPRA